MLRERITALVLAGLGVFAWVEAQRYGIMSRLFPQVVALALVLFSVIMFAQSFTIRARRAAAARRAQGSGQRYDARGVILSLLVIVAWTLSIELLGVWTASVLAFTLLVVVLRTPDQSRTAMWKSVGLGIVLVTVFVLVFRITLRVPLPEGLIW